MGLSVDLGLRSEFQGVDPGLLTGGGTDSVDCAGGDEDDVDLGIDNDCGVEIWIKLNMLLFRLEGGEEDEESREDEDAGFFYFVEYQFFWW